MNADRRPEPRLDQWFTERAARLSEPREGFEEMLAMIAVTPQRRHHWWLPPPQIGSRSAPRKLLGRMAMVLSTGLAAALVMVAFAIVSLGLLSGPDHQAPLQPAIGTEAQASTTPAPTDSPTAQPSAAPAATPTTDAAALETYRTILAGLQLKGVAPGVSRVVADAAERPLRKSDSLLLGSDGRVWITKRGRLVEVGQRIADELPDGELVLGRDGRFVVADAKGVKELDDGSWRSIGVWPEPERFTWFGWRLVGVTEAGELWAISATIPRPARLDADGWTEFHPRDMDVEWPADTDLDRVSVVSMEIASDDSIWAWLRGWLSPEEPRAEPQGEPEPLQGVDLLVRYDGESWKQVSPPIGPLLPADDYIPYWENVFHPGNGSSMWLSVLLPEAHLAHWDGSGWSTVLAPSGPVVIDRMDHVWTFKRQGRPALLRYDGSSWASYVLPSALKQVTDLSVAPDDTLWTRSAAGDLYILDPEQMELVGGDQA